MVVRAHLGADLSDTSTVMSHHLTVGSCVFPKKEKISFSNPGKTRLDWINQCFHSATSHQVH